MNAPTLERFAGVWQKVSATGDPEPVYQALVSRYSEPHRHYHSLRHIAECLGAFDAVNHLAGDPVAVELAIWFHDAVYDPHASDNEQRSAELAREWIRDAHGAPALSEAVDALVLATRTHEPSAHRDAAIMIDVDLSILGQPSERFQQYEAQIRQEYDWVTESTFATRRAEILGRFLARRRIYTTELFFAQLEKQARQNLQYSIHRLRASLRT